jgi:Predicted PP-loop superfamily ATPase
MPTAVFEMRGQADQAAGGVSGTPLQWPTRAGETSTVRSDLGWWMHEAGDVPYAAIDLARVAGSAYLADRLDARPATFTRTMDLRVAVTEPGRWSNGAADRAADLLHWLTGDQWTLTLFPDPNGDRPDAAAAAAPEGAPTSLLSGGLDSFLGALYLLQPGEPQPQFLGHADTATAVRHAQSLIAGWLSTAYTPPPSYARLGFSQVERKAENSSRSRSLLFMALATISAAANHSQTVYVPENGYTSLNIPLHPNRGGALSTRSTHPTTLQRVNELLAALELPVQITNPFADLTKGEQMAQVAAQPLPTGWEKAAAATVSCGKLDGRTFEGGNPNLNCGLCYPCVVRRGAFLAAGVTDGTVYLCDALTGDSRRQLLAKRRSDREAIAYAVERGPDDDLIDASTWPDGYDLDQASDLVRRGLAELSAVPLT